MAQEFKARFSGIALEQLERLVKKQEGLFPQDPVSIEKLRDVLRAAIAMYELTLNHVLDGGYTLVFEREVGGKRQRKELSFNPSKGTELQRMLREYGANVPYLGKKPEG